MIWGFIYWVQIIGWLPGLFIVAIIAEIAVEERQKSGRGPATSGRWFFYPWFKARPKLSYWVAGFFGANVIEGALLLLFLAARRHDASSAMLFAAIAVGFILLQYLIFNKLMSNRFLQYMNAPVQQLQTALDDRRAGGPTTTREKSLLIPPPAELLDALQSRVIGQDAALQQLAELLGTRIQLYMLNPNREKPLAVALLVGATGAGKTETAKALAWACRPQDADAAPLIVVPCNEFSDQSSVTRLVGASAGYIGSDAGGWLPRQIAAAGAGIILFDEIEKAHPDNFNIIMRLLDEGKITEAATGQTYNANGFIILLTSNAEHERIAEIADQIQDHDAQLVAIKDALRSVFRPEQLARMDLILAYRELSMDARAGLMLKEIVRRAEEVGLTVPPGGVDVNAVAHLIEKSEILKKYGARELNRYIERHVVPQMLNLAAQRVPQVRVRLGADDKLLVEAA